MSGGVITVLHLSGIYCMNILLSNIIFILHKCINKIFLKYIRKISLFNVYLFLFAAEVKYAVISFSLDINGRKCWKIDSPTKSIAVPLHIKKFENIQPKNMCKQIVVPYQKILINKFAIKKTRLLLIIRTFFIYVKITIVTCTYRY